MNVLRTRPRAGVGDFDVKGAGMFVGELELKNVQRETKSYLLHP